MRAQASGFPSPRAKRGGEGSGAGGTGVRNQALGIRILALLLITDDGLLISGAPPPLPPPRRSLRERGEGNPAAVPQSISPRSVPIRGNIPDAHSRRVVVRGGVP